MIQSTLRQAGTIFPSLHVAVVMDGNGRWAAARGRPRGAGHAAGARATRAVVEHAAALGLGTLTLYAFSSDNWRRPSGEVAGLMRLLARYLDAESERCADHGIALRVIGRRDRIPDGVRRAIERGEYATAGGMRMRLRIAVDYSARDAIRRATVTLARGRVPTRLEFAAALGTATHDAVPAPDVDLLVRTGGEQRLSDFLLWECAYAELLFTDCLWPDFGPAELDSALDAFRARERRFGRVPTGAPAGVGRASTRA